MAQAKRNPQTQAATDAMLAEDMARFYSDPLGFVMYAYDWANDKSIQTVKLPEPYNLMYDSEYGPDLWACQFLEKLGNDIKGRAFNGRDPVMPIRKAVGSGHGIGKSAMTAWLVDFIMSTRPYCQGTITANTGDQLSSKTWAQIAKWTRKCITAHWFEVTTGKGSMKMYHKEHPESWFCTAQTCREENAESFAGQHAANSTPFYLFDEASAIPEVVFDVAEGGLTDGEPMMFMFGNCTRNSGSFYDAFHSMRHRWDCINIDSRNVAITNKAQIQEWVDDHGEDSDFVKVRVRGMFPSTSMSQFISTKDVDAAYGRHLRPEQYNFAPIILTLDPAWTGEDELVFGLRQGLKFEVLKTMAYNDNDVQVANILANLEDDHHADAVIIDAGYGTGIQSAGTTMGRDWMIVWFSGASANPGCLNKRAEMWASMKRWLKEGGAIPKDEVLYRDLIAPETVPRLDGIIQLESKQDMKKRKQPSPNRADALALSFAYPVQSKHPRTPEELMLSVRKKNNETYDPYANLSGELSL